MDLICPKCQAPMRSYERSGVTVDQCTECRGIFLDRGELERLVDADTRFHGAPAAAAAPPPQPVAPAPVPPVQGHSQEYAGQEDAGQGHSEGYAGQGHSQGYAGQGHSQEYAGQGYRDDHRGPSYGNKPHKRRKSFIEELFD